MKTPWTSRTFTQLASLVIALGLTSGANAVPIEVTFVDSGGAYSFVRDGASPAPAGSADDYLRFDGAQVLALDLTGDLLTLDGGPQSFDLMSANGASAVLDILSLSLDLNDTDGFLGGSMDYALDGVGGTFSFPNVSYDAFPFNSSSLIGSSFELYLWGGDDVNDLSADFGMVGTVVPEPATGMLFVLGLLGIVAARRGR